MIHAGSQIWTTDTIADIHSRAQGNYQLSNFKTLREIPSFDELVFLASGLTRFPLEGYKEKCNTETVLGSRFSRRPLVLDIPIYVGSGPGLPEEVRAALSRGASLASTAVSISGKMSAEERQSDMKLIFGIPPLEGEDAGYKKKSFPLIKADAIQIDLFSYRTGAKELANMIQRIRKETDRDVPVFVSMPAGQVRSDVKAAAKAGADAIVLQGLSSAAGTDPRDLLKMARVPIVAAIARAREALRECELLGEVDLIASTGIRNGADAAKALALGADAVVIDESALIALNYSSPALVHSKTPMDDKNQRENYGLESGDHSPFDSTGQSLAKFINSITMEMALLARSLGKGNVHSLEFEDLSALTIEASMMTGIRLSGE